MFGHNKKKRHQAAVEAPDQLASAAGRIYWLALLLTDDDRLAVSVTCQNIEQLVTDDPVFVRWIGRWSRRVMIKACIAAKQAELAADQRNRDCWDAAAAEIEIGNPQQLHEFSIDSIQRSARSLPVLPRFLLVMNALEGYSLLDAAQLLQIPRSICQAALRYALATFTDAIHGHEHQSGTVPDEVLMKVITAGATATDARH